MSLPLNVPYLLSRLRPNAKYVMNGRSYGDIMWLDDNEKVPTLLELENEFHRIQALEREHKTSTQILEDKANQTAHEKTEKAKAEVAVYAAETARLVAEEVSRMNVEVQAERSKSFIKIAKMKEEQLKELERDVEERLDNLARELALAHNQMIDGGVVKIRKALVATPDRVAVYPSKDEMAKAIRGGRKSIQELAKKMRDSKLK